ncbi:MAG: carbohydrate kinase family protein [Patescibacteria group bacterium]|jgi:sugar/nucleoside kinase (ribokinase family)
MKPFDVITIGSAVRDMMFFTDQAETLPNPKNDPTKAALIGFEYGGKIHSDKVHRFYGGGASNTAACFSRLGLRTATCLCVGQDAEGQALVQHLQSIGVSTQYVQSNKQLNTGLSFLVVETKTNEHVAFVNYGANDELELPPTILKHLPNWFYVSSLSSRHWPTIMRTLTKMQTPIAWNPGAIQLADRRTLLPLLKHIAVLILNRDEAIELYQAEASTAQLAKALHLLGPHLVVVTDSKRGACVFDGQTLYHDKPKLTKPKDTTGAGDAFGSSFIAGLIKCNGNIKTALRLAILNATGEVSHIGAQNGLLTWNQIRQKL